MRLFVDSASPRLRWVTWLAVLLLLTGIATAQSGPADFSDSEPGPAAAPSVAGSAVPSVAGSAAPSVAGSAAPSVAAPAPASDPRCRPGNLLEKRRAVSSEYVNNTERITDGATATEGDSWKTDMTAEFTSGAGRVEWDLGAVLPIRLAYLQGDNNDEYVLEVSTDRKSWTPAWTAPFVTGAGMRLRTTDALNLDARWVRLGAQKGDQAYSIGEIQLFCARPSSWPPILESKKGTFKDATAERNKRYAFAKLDLAALGFVFFFFLLAPWRPGTRAFDLGHALALGLMVRYPTVWIIDAIDYMTPSWPLRVLGWNVATVEALLVGLVAGFYVLWSYADRLRLGWLRRPEIKPLMLLLTTGLVLVHTVLVTYGASQLLIKDLTLGTLPKFSIAQCVLGVCALAGTVIVGLFVYRWLRGRPLLTTTERSGLLVIAFAAGYGWTMWGTFHGNRAIHFWDTFHYYAGAKYFHENRYTNLYYCVQWAEIEAGRQKVVEARKVRNLHTNLLEETDEIIAHPEHCKDAYTPERWAEFKGDVEYFRRNMGADWWDKMFKDHGYNASPVWNFYGQYLTNLGPANDTQIRWLCAIDAVLYVTLFLAIAWAFGLRTFALALLILGTGYPWAYFWTGGAFARVAWLWWATLGICFLKKRWFFAGGLALMCTILDRAFPGALVGGLGVAVLTRVGLVWWPRRREAGAFKTMLLDAVRLSPEHKRIGLGAVAAVLIFVPLGAWKADGFKAYGEFWQNSQKHVATPLTNHMGLPTVFTYHPKHVARVSKDDKTEDPYQGWKDKRNEILRDRRPFWALTTLALVVLVGFWSRWNREDWKTTAASTIFIVCLFQLTCYYYNFVILLAPLAVARARHALAYIAMPMVGYYFQLRISWYDEQYTWETIVVLVFMIYLLLDQGLEGRRLEREAAKSDEGAPAEKPLEDRLLNV
jgi:hypothetical protein